MIIFFNKQLIMRLINSNYPRMLIAKLIYFLLSFLHFKY